MLQTRETETEILLGNKQLLGIFFVVAVLLGVAFAGGYMIGHRSAVKKAEASTPAPTAPQPASDDTSANTSAAGGQTHSLPAQAEANGPKEAAYPQSHETSPGEPPPLGARKGFAKAPGIASESGFSPQNGETFLQVAAVGHGEADEIAQVLRKKSFRAHAVPKPGNAKLYRVLIGPIRDAGDLSATREALRKAGFSEVIVQKY